MKINEIITSNQGQSAVAQPAAVKQQARVAKVVANIAASDTKQAPSEMDKVLAMRAYADMKDRADKDYKQRLKQQLSNAKRIVR